MYFQQVHPDWSITVGNRELKTLNWYRKVSTQNHLMAKTDLHWTVHSKMVHLRIPYLSIIILNGAQNQEGHSAELQGGLSATSIHALVTCEKSIQQIIYHKRQHICTTYITINDPNLSKLVLGSKSSCVPSMVQNANISCCYISEL